MEKGWWTKPLQYVDTVSQENGNTSSMATHLKQHHPGVLDQGQGSKTQQLITAALKQPLAAESDRG